MPSADHAAGNKHPGLSLSAGNNLERVETPPPNLSHAMDVAWAEVQHRERKCISLA